MNTKTLLAAASLAALIVPGIASAALVLDTGTPSSSALALSLDSNDFYAAEFNLAAGSTVTSIETYVTNAFFADSPGDTFTLALYSGNGFLNNRSPTPLFTTQGTYGSNPSSPDGWNGATGLAWNVTTTGSYWVAVEVNPPADTAVQLALPTPVSGGTAAALDFAYNDGGSQGYSDAGALPFGVQVTATTPVPLPPSIGLLAGVLLAGVAMARRRSSGAGAGAFFCGA